MSDHRETALRLVADTTRPDRFDSESMVHALLYVGDRLAAVEEQLADQNLELSEIVSALRGTTSATPKLAATLAAPSPFQEPEAPDEPEVAVNGEVVMYRKYPPKHNPADWQKLPDGRWLSPAGRRYGAYSRPVIGVVRARMKLGLPV